MEAPSPTRDPSPPQSRSPGPALSIVVPVLDEHGALPQLLDELEAACAELGKPYELIFVDDGSTDGTTELLSGLAESHHALIALSFARNLGKSAALMAGIQRSSGDIVVTIDGDGQDDPAEIPALLAEIDAGYDLVSGWKRDRQDPSSRRWASRLFNWTTRRLSGVELHDFNCGFKAYRGSQIRSLDIHGELHRYIPVLGDQRGWRIKEVPVNHRPRVHGSTKFGFERYTRGMLDLVGVLFMGRYQNRPLHLFGGLGLISMFAGFAIALYLTILKISGEAIGDRPLLLLGVLLILVGIQFLTFGLLGQMLVSMRHDRSRAPTAEMTELSETHEIPPRNAPSES